MALSKPTNGSNADYANRIGLLFDAFNNGNYAFPAVQVPSADPNTLDDYEEGTWTPAFSFATPGNLTVVYSIRIGEYTKIGRHVELSFNMSTSTFTHTTASGNATITGFPFTVGGTLAPVGALFWGGITKAGYTNITMSVPAASTQSLLGASGSGQVPANIAVGDVPSGGTVFINGALGYRV
jgi:hypothetical protein